MVNDMFSQIDLLKRGLDASWVRNEVIANNIANIDTQNFKRSDVSFSKILNESLNLKTTRNKHINPGSDAEGGFSLSIYEDSDSKIRMEGNNVDIDHEMNELAKNTLWYNYLSQMVTKEITRLSMAINGGK